MSIELRLFGGAVARCKKLQRGTSNLAATYAPKRGDEFVVLYLGRVKKDAPIDYKEMLAAVGLQEKP